MTKLKYKLMLAIITTSFTIVAILGGYDIYNQICTNKKEIAEYRTMLLQQFDRANKLEVETACNLVQNVYNQQQKGLISEEDAKKKAAGLVRDIRFDNSGYFWIDTTEGVNVVLLGGPAEGKNRFNAQDPNGTYFIQDIIKAAMQPDGGYSEWMFPKPNEKTPTAKRGYSLLFAPYKWVIGTGNWIDDIDAAVAVKQADYDANLKRNICISVLLILLSLGVAVGMAIYISKKITNPIVKVAGSVQQIADGNLGGENITVDSHDEIGLLAQVFNQMKENLRTLVTQVAGATQQVTVSSEELTATSEKTAMAASHVAEASLEIASGSESQVKSVNEVLAVIERMSASIQQIAATANQVTGTSNESAAASQNGGKAIVTAIAQMSSIESSVVASADVVSKLGERSKEIGHIVETISGIAGQTNLLALNAAIEAARAGEQGRGFAVVAEEVRKLAEQSEAAAKEIAALIMTIQTDTEHAVQSMVNGTRETKLGMEVVNTAGTAFEEISRRINQVSGQIAEISASISDMATSSQKVVESVRDIEKNTREIANEIQTVSAETEEQSAAMQQVAASSESLSKAAQGMQGSVSKFRLS
ncbi:MAG: methyl-accepting chemotaxis protein [Pelosinus sp.]|nr:methyl-accepting chemotaxis protein [Pelosinus sp.]